MPDHTNKPADSKPPTPPPHVIRLLGPWEGRPCIAKDAEGGVAERPVRVKVPLRFGDWLPADFCGTVTLERAFGLPTNLGVDQATHIVIQSHGLTIEDATLNQNPIALVSSDAAAARFNAGPSMQARNRLWLTLQIDDLAIANLVEARLEIINA